jgi:hypothetical protein
MMNKLLSFEMTYRDPADPRSPGILSVVLELQPEWLNPCSELTGQPCATHPALSEEWIAEAFAHSDLFPGKCPP